MYTWNLQDIYEDNNISVQNDINRLDNLVKNFQKHKDYLEIHLVQDAIEKYEEISSIIKKLSVYSFLYSVTQLNNPDATRFTQTINEKLANISSQIAFFINKISAMDYKTLIGYLEHNKDLSEYKLWFENIFKDKDHILSTEAEEVLVKKSTTSRESWVRLYNELLSRITIKYKNTTKNISQMIEIANHNMHPREREIATCSINQELSKHSFYITHVYNNIMLDVSTEQNLRSRYLPESERHVHNNISQEDVNKLTETVISNYAKIPHRYYKIKAALLDKEKLEYWDRNAPITKSNILTRKINYQEACDIVLDVFGKFSPVFRDIAYKFINESWIDVYPKIGKDSGAFSCSCTIDTHPYIMLNYSDNIRDVYTLAHELGHGIHQYLSADKGTLLSNTPITISETASLFAEKMLFEYMFNMAKTKEEKIDLICARLDDMINSNMRQIAFFQFERECHDKRKIGELSHGMISEIWLNIQKNVCGDHVNIDERISNLWSIVSHFFNCPFYVYAYSFGEIFVNALYAQYQKIGDQFIDQYIHTLSRGGIDSYETIADNFNLNIKGNNFWQSGLDSIIAQINLLEIYM